VQRLVELKNAPVVDNPLAHIQQLRGVADEFMTKMTVPLEGAEGGP